MARAFTTASTQRLKTSGVDISGAPLTFACVVRPTLLTTFKSLLVLAKDDGATTNQISFRLGADNTDHFTMAAQNGASVASAASTVTFSADTDYRIMGTVTRSGGDYTASLWTNGADFVTGTATVTAIVATSAYIGATARENAAIISHADSTIGEAAIWNVALGAADAAAFAAGYSPRLIRPASLINCWPMRNAVGATSNEPELVRGRTATQTNSPALAGHPRVLTAIGPR
jgi:hypothetical protein